MGVTFSVLLILITVAVLVSVIIRGLTVLLGRDRPARRVPAAGTGPAAPSAPPVAALTPGAPPPEHVAAIAAAVSTTFDDSAVVVHIEPSRRGSGWTSEGRAAHHGSHNVGRPHR